MNLNRLMCLIGEDNLNKIKNTNILVLGLGGVGGYTVETLVRSGIQKITLVDGDVIEKSNINRQIISNRYNTGFYKTKITSRRIKSINKDAKVTIINKMIKVDDIPLLFMQNYDYIVDACDTSSVKTQLIKECYNKKIKIISCMGTAKRLDATKVVITSLDQVEGDPLGKKVKEGLTSEEKEYTVVVRSTERPKVINELGSTSYVPAVAGILITNYIINDIIK